MGDRVIEIMSVEPGYYKISGVEITSGGFEYPVHKFYIKLGKHGKLKGKKYFEEAEGSSKQKCKTRGHWSEDEGKLSWTYSFKWDSGEIYEYSDSVTFSADDGMFIGEYNGLTNGSVGQLKYTLDKCQGFSSSSGSS